MFEMSALGRALVCFGIIIVVIGAMLMLGAKLSWFGRLPGDICIQKKGFTFFFPITTSILISIILSVIAMVLRRR